ncbi:MAG: DUF1570 domain-containing protein [Planctomycetes bacterium]|nr:DUF1570 domain-containing protein [Planctomycetota bacterium]
MSALRELRRWMLRASVALLVGAGAGAGTSSLAAGDEDRRDEVELQGGSVLRGRIVLEDPDKLVVRMEGAEREIPRAQVLVSKSVFRAQGAVLSKYAGLATNDTASLLALAEQCRASELPHEEQLFLWLVLLVDGQNQVAHSRLGHRDRGGRWMVPQRGGAVSFEKLLEIRDSWGKAWELRSEHYSVRCDAGLAEAIGVVLELEQFYRAFYELYQQRLSLREVLVPMQVEVYRDRSRFPRVSTHVDSRYEPTTRLLQTYAKDGVARALFHEATRQLLYELSGGSERALGEMPPWLGVGWGEYMEGILLRPAGRRTGVLELAPKRLQETHRALFERTPEAKRYGLHRVLNFGVSDFEASSGQGQKYAQCYLLFHYLMHAQGDLHQARFLSYLRIAFEGRGQASSFRELFDSAAIERDLPSYQGR